MVLFTVLLFMSYANRTGADQPAHSQSIISVYVVCNLINKLYKHWFNNEIRKIIRKRKHAHRHAKKVNTQTSFEKFRSLRNKSISAMRKSKQEFKDNLSNKITTGKFSSKDWWKTVKLLLGKDKNDDIPPLLLNGQPINDPRDKANAFKHYFYSQTQLDYSNVPVPELSQPDYILSSIELTIDEVESTLKSNPLKKHVALTKSITEY